MRFKFCHSMILDYRTQGYVVFRQILPLSLIRDLRRATEKVHQYAREKGGPQAQRLQPIINYDMDLKPFYDYANLPELVDAIGSVLTPRHQIARGEVKRTGVLLEPAEKPWCTRWHRDLRHAEKFFETSNVPDMEEFRRIKSDPLWFNQINCPLYEDNSLWYVPGSYLRMDLPEEVTAAEAPLPPEEASYEERERKCLQYTQAMPGAVRLYMDAGDFALYHPRGWHIGVYLPDRKRVTIHDYAPTPEYLDWYRCYDKKRASATKN